MSRAYSGDWHRVQAPWDQRRASAPERRSGGTPVGFFKNIKSTMGSATEAAKYSKQVGNEISGIQSGELGYDPNDPAVAPSAGVDRDPEARIKGGVQKNRGM